MKRLVRLPDGVLAVRDEGPREVARANGRAAGRARDPECVVLLHGFTGSAATWLRLRAALRRTRRVIAIDLPGHGATRMYACFDWSLASTAALVDTALAALDVGRYALVGYSMGGRVALQLALAASGRVTHLVLESASAGQRTATSRAERRRADEALATAIERDGMAAFVRRWEALPLFCSLATVPARRRLALRRQRLACAPAGLAASLRGMGSGVQPWLGDRVGELAMPVLLVAGALDRKFARIARTLATRMPRARMALVDAAGHLPHFEQPAEFEHLVHAFLDARVNDHSTTHEEDMHADLLA
jgi:2-succinyl-6-hydroxy-2,4-cyclohexadiene-1-carboxylate synthase